MNVKFVGKWELGFTENIDDMSYKKSLSDPIPGKSCMCLYGKNKIMESKVYNHLWPLFLNMV